MTGSMKTLECKTRAEWRAWLAENHERENEIWLAYYKKATGIACIAYGDSLDEALQLLSEGKKLGLR